MSKKFKTVTGHAAVLSEHNIDTDIIFPARFLLITEKEGLGQYALHDRRFESGGKVNEHFILNQSPWDKAKIIIAGEAFGCGSSREQAVWALTGFGIRCVIALSFGEIFKNNCYRNGVLPIELGAKSIEDMTRAANSKQKFKIDLPSKTIEVGGMVSDFEIAEEQRLALLNGWDETLLILNQYSADIEAFEKKHKAHQPWLF